MNAANGEGRSVVFTTLAMNQSLFFQLIGTELKKQGITPHFVCFHERSHEYLRAAGEKSYNVFDYERQHPLSAAEIEAGFTQVCSRYGFPQNGNFLNHEKAAFNLRSTARLKRKIFYYSSALAEILTQIRSDSQPWVVQELGGFTSLVSTYYVARSLGLEHLFLEPAFFKGRFFAIQNSYAAQDVSVLAPHLSAPLQSALEQILANKRIVIPSKDVHHYWGLRKKILNVYNFRRLVQKFTDKYFLGKREEFSYLYAYCTRHLKMFVKKFYFQKDYAPIPAEKFIYYPLHVPMDAALTLRSPQYLDQYALIDYIARSIPLDCKLCIKEHPAMVGVINWSRMCDLLKRHDNLILLNPALNNYDVLDKTELLVTVNSKTGAEALLKQKRVLVLGDAFYQNCPLLARLSDYGNLAAEIATCLKGPAPQLTEVARYFQSVWDASHPGEIYSTDFGQVQGFSQLIAAQLTQRPAPSKNAGLA